jgi:hypothetical protein
MKISKKTCDTALQSYIKRHNSKCLVCGMKCQVGHHYVLTKNSAFLRYYLPNIIPLCFSCHYLLHRRQDVTIIVGIFIKMGIDWFNDLMNKKKLPVKTNKKYYENVYDKLSKD